VPTTKTNRRLAFDVKGTQIANDLVGITRSDGQMEGGRAAEIGCGTGGKNLILPAEEPIQQGKQQNDPAEEVFSGWHEF
jgi:hypothetical protein